MLIYVLLILGFILLNGLFAMSEIAIVGARRARLTQMAEEGHRGAARALQLSMEPSRFLATVQVGITAIGILSGAVGERQIASRLQERLATWPVIAPFAEELSLVVIVVALTYVSLILGELVPKRLALTRPEIIASLIATPMSMLAAAGRPVVHVLSRSTDFVLGLFRLTSVPGSGITSEEIKVLIEQATREGVFEAREQELVTNVLDLNERTVGSILTPRSEVVFIDLRVPFDENRGTLTRSPHSVLPVCDGGLDHVVGVVRATDILQKSLAGGPVDFKSMAQPALFVPQSVSLMKLLEQFKRMHLPVAIVIDEFGDVEGLVSLTDVVSAIVGDLPVEPGQEPSIVQREDGSWLVDGSLDIDTVRRAVGWESGDDEDAGEYRTLGGFAMFELGRVPKTGDVFSRDGYRFEVVDMDGNRVDRVLVGPDARDAAPGARPS
jgi:putative hemolysin